MRQGRNITLLTLLTVIFSTLFLAAFRVTFPLTSVKEVLTVTTVVSLIMAVVVVKLKTRWGAGRATDAS